MAELVDRSHAAQFATSGWRGSAVNSIDGLGVYTLLDGQVVDRGETVARAEITTRLTKPRSRTPHR
ncbi:MAG: hypothetical protein U0163_08035 [Gemmatimonadaceae bacterium]